MEELLLKAGVMLLAAIGMLLVLADFSSTNTEKHQIKTKIPKKW